MSEARVATSGKRAGDLLDHLGRMTRVRSEEALAPLGLRPRQYVALTLLELRGPTNQATVGHVLHLDPANVVGLLNQLEEAGYVVRRRDTGDRRRHVVEVTDAGRRIIERAREALAAVDDEILGGLGPDERELLGRLLERAAGYDAESICMVSMDGAREAG